MLSVGSLIGLRRRRSIFNHVIHSRKSSPRQLTQIGIRTAALKRPTHFILGALFAIALLAFELFNFDTTRFALNNLFGDEHVFGLGWATVLAIAFCTIDFAGLLRLFLPDGRHGTPAEVWYLMGAWLLGATLNAIMTCWAVALTLLDQPLGNEIMDREMLLTYVPIFVACLVWLTRILFIGSLSVTSEYLFLTSDEPKELAKKLPQRPVRRPASPPAPTVPFRPVTDELPPFLTTEPSTHPPRPVTPANTK